MIVAWMHIVYQLVLQCKDDGADVLSGVADNGEQHDTDEADWEAPGLWSGLDVADDVLREDGDEESHEVEPEECAGEPEH